MDWKDVAGIVGKVAPALGAVLAPATGGVSLAIGAAVGALTNSLGLSPDAAPEEVLAAIQGDPEARLKLLVAENDYKLKVRDQELQELKIYIEDAQSARSRQVESEKATGRRDTNLYVLAWTIIIGFFALVGILLFVRIPEDSTGVIFMLFGALSAAFGGVVQYFFGSSKGSADKSEQISALRRSLK